MVSGRLEHDYGWQVLGESAVGGLDGRQSQDAAIVGVGLRVAPGPENRQQWLRVSVRGGGCGLGGGEGLSRSQN